MPLNYTNFRKILNRTFAPIIEVQKLFRKYYTNLEFQAERDYIDFNEILQLASEKYKLRHQGLKVLDIGCGQRYPQALLMADENDVIAIDISTILTNWSPLLIGRILLNEGIKRTVKTIVRKALFDKRYYRKLAKLNGRGFRRKPTILRMNAENLQFPDNTFDFAFSVGVFEHLGNVDKCVANMNRVLKPGGIFAIIITNYTGLTGGHNLYGEDETTTKVPPWDHLRKNIFPSDVYLNGLRIADYKRIFNKYFDDFKFYEEEANQYAKYLSDEIRKELSAYSEHELLTLGISIIGRKNPDK